MKTFTKTELIAAIDAAQAEVHRLGALLAAGQYTEPVKVGDDVIAKYGRGDKARDITGKIVAVEGNQVIILAGFETFKVFAKDVRQGTSEPQAGGTDAPPDTPPPANTTAGDTTEPKDALAVTAQDDAKVLTEAEQLDALQRQVLTPEQYAQWKAGQQ